MRAFILSLLFCTTINAAEPAKDEALEKYIKLTRAAEAFKIGAEAGFDVGFDPKNNPAFALIDEKKLKGMRQDIKELFEKEFTFDKIKDEMKSSIDSSFTLEELNEINAILEKPIMQKYLDQQIKNIPNQMSLGQDVIRPLQPKITAIVKKHLSQP